jgi:hypothetical protein
MRHEFEKAGLVTLTGVRRVERMELVRLYLYENQTLLSNDADAWSPAAGRPARWADLTKSVRSGCIRGVVLRV